MFFPFCSFFSFLSVYFCLCFLSFSFLFVHFIFFPSLFLFSFFIPFFLSVFDDDTEG